MKRRLLGSLSAVVLLGAGLVLVAAPGLEAQTPPVAGSLDAGFDRDGKVTTFFSSGNDRAFSVAVQPDGKIVAVGYSENGSDEDSAVVRYNADGSLDTGFGSGGKVTTAFGTGDDSSTHVAVQPDGKIVVAGYSKHSRDEDFAVVRYNADGSLDTGFGSGGKVTTPFSSGHDIAFSVAVQPDGKIVAAGVANLRSFAVVRYNADGSLDTGFGSDGKASTTVGSRVDIATSVAVQSDGKIVLAGYSLNFGNSAVIAVVRFSADGSLDTGFDTDGKVTTSFSSLGNDRAFSVAVQPDGRIVVAGYSNNGSDDDFAVVRYNADGSLDTGFDTDGKVTTPFSSGNDKAFEVAVQPDGRIVAAGYSNNGSNDDFAVVRYNTDGSLDTGFGSGGKVTTPFSSGNDGALSVAVQPDGKIVAVGYSHSGTDDDFAVVRYNTDGSLDAGFDRDGKVTTPFSSGHDRAFEVAVQPDGKIVAVGYSENGSDEDFAVVRYNADGSLDTGFGSGGKVTTAFGTGDDSSTHVAVQLDGKIVVAGYSENGSDEDFAVVRYNADGSLDTGFGSGGKVTTPFSSGNDRAFSVAVQPDGKIVAAGVANLRSFAVVRYNADGSLDTGFGSDGKASTTVGSRVDIATSMAVQSDGKIVLAGYSLNFGNSAVIAVVRFSADGSLDTGFDTDGKVTTSFSSGNDRAFSVAVQPDGRIVVAGYSNNGSDEDFAVVRYNADGSLDTGFGSGGKVTTAIGSVDGGKVTTAIGSSDDQAFGVAVQSDGKIVLAGYSLDFGNSVFAVVRYNTDGSLDAGFDRDGKVTTSFSSGNDRAFSVAVQPDGKIVAVGYSNNGSNDDFAVVRYLGKTPPPIPPTLPTLPTLPTGGPSTPQRSTARVSGFELDVRRVGGVDRFETSVLLAREYGTRAGRLDAVVLVSGVDFPDALSASALAGVLDAPLLYVGPDSLPEQVAEFIGDRGVARVFIVGGETAVSAGVQAAVAALSPVREVTRIGGVDRFGTSVEVASRVAALGSGVGGWCGDGAKTVLLASGAVFADALSASPAAAAGPHPLLLTGTGTLPDSVRAWLTDAAEAGTVERVVIVGGAAAVSADVQDGIEQMGLATVRIAGDDRYATSARFAARTECIAKNHLAAATGDDYADGLGAGPLLARLGGALVLVQPDRVPGPVAEYAASTRRFRSDGEGTVWILGGRAAISNAVLAGLRDIIRDANAP